MERKNYTYRISLVVLVATYFVGILGFQWPDLRPLFLMLTPFHLLMTAFLLVINTEEKWPKLVLFMLLSALIGYSVEVVGVKTGLIFGNYQYGPTLGFKRMDVPLMIGVNWFLLTFSIAMTLKAWIKNETIATFIGGILLVGLDYFIEPVAVRLDFWSWQNGQIPFQNYMGWLITSWLILFIFQKIKFNSINPLAKYLLLCQGIFFIVLSQFSA